MTAQNLPTKKLRHKKTPTKSSNGTTSEEVDKKIMLDEVEHAIPILESMRSPKIFSSSEFVNAFKSRKDKIPPELRPSTVVYSCSSTIVSDVGPSSLCYRISHWNSSCFCEKWRLKSRSNS